MEPSPLGLIVRAMLFLYMVQGGLYSSCYVALQIMMCEMRCSSNMPLPYKFFCASIARSIYTMLSDVVIIANLHIYFCQR